MYYACVVYTGELEMTEAMEIALARYPAVGNLVIPKTALNMACSSATLVICMYVCGQLKRWHDSSSSTR